MRRIVRWLAGLLIVFVCGCIPFEASAHGFRPGVLTLEELDPGVFTIRWTAPVDTSRSDVPIELVFPASCRQQETLLRCAPEGLVGAITFSGLAEQRAPVVVRASFEDGRTVEAMVWPEDPTWSLEHPESRSAWAWINAGVRHIFGGLDHLAFLLGLLMVVGFASLRRLVATVTAFTVAHSGALMLGALGWVHLRAAPVEATIAASVVLVARECLRQDKPGAEGRPSLTQRWPWAMALLFGLVHGLGFAGALNGEMAGTTLASTVVLFNVGVELGQLAIVVVCYGLVRVLPSTVRRLRDPVSYALGSVAALWLIERTWAMLTAAS